jgi:glycosyltransferase involved in cell wall biosynthesis
MMMHNRHLRVCLIKHASYPENVRTRKEAQALLREGHAVDVICLVDDKCKLRHEVVEGVGVYRVPVRHLRKGVVRYLYEYLAALLLFAWTVTRLHLRKRYDIVQIANMPDFHIFAALVPKLLGAKVVINLHECMPEIYMIKYGMAPTHPVIRALQWVEQLAIAFSDHAITCNEEMTRIFVGRGAPAHKFSAVLNTPERDRFIEGVTGEERPADGTFRLITHGSIEERYGIDTAVRAMAILRQEIPGVQLQIFGKGTALQGLKDLAASLDLGDCVTFRGFVPDAELAAGLQAADVGLVTIVQSPATRWVHTFKMFEYLSIGKPAVISRSRSLEDYFDDSCVAYFDNNDPAELARAVLELYRRPEQRAALARHASQVYDTLKWSVRAGDYCRTMERLAWSPPDLRATAR